MSENKFKIFFFSGTHWDREWYQHFQGFRFRLVSMMNEVIDTLEKDSEFKVFHFDGQTIMLEDFIEIESEKRESLSKLIKERRLLVGPWYVMPDEFLLSGESLVKNLIMGHRIAQEWGTEAWKYGYICDIFGHIAQMPQIFNGFGINGALLGRGTNEHSCPAYFRWVSPDGSECLTYKLMDTDGYSAFFLMVIGSLDNKYNDINELYPRIKNYIDYEIKRSKVPIVVVMDGSDHEKIHTETPQFLKMIQEIYPQAEVRHEDLSNLNDELKEYYELLPIKFGEINEVAKIRGTYLHLITHTLSSRYPIKLENDICQFLLEKWVEPLTAIAELIDLDIQKNFVELAYKFLLQNHPHDSICGCSIDQVHKDMEYRFDQCKLISNQIIDEFIRFDRSRYKINNDSDDMVLILWNSLPYPRSEVVTVEIDFDLDYPEKYKEPFGYELKNSFKIFDQDESEIPYIITDIKRDIYCNRHKQFMEKADLYKISLEVQMPAMGKSEYKIVPFKDSSRYLNSMSKNDCEVENKFIKLKINQNGTIKVTNKCTGKSYDNLLSFVDDGEIGDGWYHVNPTVDRKIYSEGSVSIVELIENGPSRTVFKVTKEMRIPREMNYHSHGISRSEEYIVLKIISRVGLSKNAQHVDIETSVINNAKDHRLRMILPTGIKTNEYFANQAFTFVKRKTGINFETQEWKECDVLEKQMAGIVGKRDADGTGLVFISAYGLHECAAMDDDEGTLLVTLLRSFRKTVMTNGENAGQIQGKLEYKFSIMPINENDSFADLIRLQDIMGASIKHATVKVELNHKIQYSQSYFEILSDNICLSILKRPEEKEKNTIIIRLYNCSDILSKAEILCFKEILKACEVNLNEEKIRTIPCLNKKIIVELEPWKIRTYKIKIKT